MYTLALALPMPVRRRQSDLQCRALLLRLTAVHSQQRDSPLLPPRYRYARLSLAHAHERERSSGLLCGTLALCSAAVHMAWSTQRRRRCAAAARASRRLRA